jgi:hypothetical protein
MSLTAKISLDRTYGLSGEFDSLTQKIIQSLDRNRLTELRKDFHTRLRIVLAQPETPELVGDLWDYFYDWCLFEQFLPDDLNLLPEERAMWNRVKSLNTRGLFLVQKLKGKEVRLKELYSAKSFFIELSGPEDFLGISKADLIECRILGDPNDPKKTILVRRPSYHPAEVHDYLRKKVKLFRKSQDFSTYQSWLWLVVGMYLKHKIYRQMPIEKIYDDNSRI